MRTVKRIIALKDVSYAILTAMVTVVVGLNLQSCQDAPVDGSGTVVVRDSSESDTVVIYEIDTVVVDDTDTLFITKSDTLFITKFDTIEVPSRDTVKVPVEVERYKQAILLYRGWEVGLDNTFQRPIEVDISKYLQYEITVDPVQGHPVGLELSMNATVPESYHEYISGNNEKPFIVRGLTLSIPSFRFEALGGQNILDSFSLENHPHFAMESRTGGMALTTSFYQGGGVMRTWTGEVIEIDDIRGIRTVQNVGRFTVTGVNTVRKILAVRIPATFYIAAWIRNEMIAQEFEVVIEMELGYR